MRAKDVIGCVCLLLAGAGIAAAAPGAAGFDAPRADVLRDRGTGLVWTQKDSGYAVDWFDARGYCTKLGAQWRLPSAEALDAMGATLRAEAAACSAADCKASGPFRLGSGWVWSDTSNGISDAVAVNLLSGEHQVAYRTRKQRALCVSDA